MFDTADNILEKNLKTLSYHHPLSLDLIRSAIVQPSYPQETFDPLDLSLFDEIEGLFVFGLMEGHFIEHFLPWLQAKEQRRLFICDDTIHRYKHFLSQTACENLITTKRVHFLITPDGINPKHNHFLRSIIHQMVMIFNLKSAQFIEHPLLKDETGQRESSFNDALEKGLSEFYATDMHLKGTQHKALVNRLETLSINQDFILLDSIKNLFKGTPIILCSAGFSLPKVYKKLKQIQGHTLIAAAGTGATLLSKNGIESHFNGIIDVEPKKEHAHEYNNQSGVLLFLLRAGCAAISQHQGLKILCHAAKESVETKKLLGCEDLKSSYNHNPWTVSDFLLSQLLELGFGPIYLCGLDHVMSETHYYGDQVLGETANNCSKKMHIRCKNIKGEMTLSKFDWTQGSKAISTLASRYPETKIIYVSDEGLPIDHVELISTDTFNQLDFKQDQVCEDQYLPALLQAPQVHIEHQAIIDLLDLHLNSLTTCKELLLKTEIALGELYSIWQLIPIDDLNPYTGIFFQLQKSLYEESAFREFLEPTWDCFKSQLHSESGFFQDPLKAKLTLFGLKIRELDFHKNNCMIFYNLFSMQRTQIQERLNNSKTQASPCTLDTIKTRLDPEVQMV